MRIVRKALCSTLVLACFVAVAPVKAQTEEATSKPRAVLFKIHDIKPSLNTEGLVTSCDFMVTFYNRTTDSLRPARLEMGWTDEISDQYVIDVNQKEEEKVEKRLTADSKNTKTEQLGEIVTYVDMPSLGSYKQVSVKANVKTEKCFLLMDGLEYNVAECGLVGKGDASDSGRRRSTSKQTNTSECASLFEYIDSSNPEYHDEFKNISYSEQEEQIIDDRKKDIRSLEDGYNKVVKNFEKADKIIGNIQ